MSKFIFLLLLSSSFAFAQSSSEIEFKSSTHSFLAVLTKTTFKFSDQLGNREIAIKECNRSAIISFWDQIKEQIGNLQSSRNNPPPTKAWIKLEGVQFPVLETEDAFRYLISVPNKSHILFSQSERLCKNN